MQQRILRAIAILMGLAGTAAAAEQPEVTTWADLMPPGEKAPLPLFGHTGPVFDLDVPEQPGTFNINLEAVGQSSALQGFMVPLDVEEGRIARFLLVPYFGACIHLPPPPPNQIVEVTPAEPLKLTNLERPVLVRGILRSQISHSELGGSAYSIHAESVRIMD